MNNAVHYTNGVHVQISGSAAANLRVDVGEASTNRVKVYYTGAADADASTLDACVLLSAHK